MLILKHLPDMWNRDEVHFTVSSDVTDMTLMISFRCLCLPALSLSHSHISDPDKTIQESPVVLFTLLICGISFIVVHYISKVAKRNCL